MKRAFLAGLVLLSSCLARPSDQGAPRVLVEFFGPKGIEDKTGVYHGEMLEHYSDAPTLGQSLKANTQVTFRKLEEGDLNAVYAALLCNGPRTQDWYAFLVKEKGDWKLSAVRTLAQTGVLQLAVKELEQKPARTREEEWTLQNLLLTLKSDRELKGYLGDHLVEFDRLIQLFSKEEKEEWERTAKSLFLSSVKKEGETVQLTVGGIIDNMVGFLYVEPGGEPPKMDPEEYIYVERVTGGWYLFKTT